MSVTSPVENMPQTETPNANPDHAEGGRFAEGNKGGPGNPHARETAKLRSMALQFMTEGKFLVLLETLYDAAIAGSIPAIRLLLQYTLGKPLDAQDPDKLDVDEFSLHQKSSHTPKELDALLNSLSVDYLNQLARNVWPMMVAAVTSSCAERLKQEMAVEETAKQAAPSANAVLREPPPSANGDFSQRPPSANVSNAARAPSANGIFRGQAVPGSFSQPRTGAAERAPADFASS